MDDHRRNDCCSNSILNSHQCLGPVFEGNLDVQDFLVFNRWGKVVYEWDGSGVPAWDGTFEGELQARDTYIYKMVYLDPAIADPVVLTGDITLIR